MTGTLHEDQYTFFIISRSVLRRMRNVSDEPCRENRNISFAFNFHGYTVHQYSQIFYYPTNALNIQIICLLKTH